MFDDAIEYLLICVLLCISLCFLVLLVRSIVVARKRRCCSSWLKAPLNEGTLDFQAIDNHFFKVKAHFVYSIEGKIFRSDCAYIGSNYDGVSAEEKKMLEDILESRSCLVNPEDYSKSVLAFKVVAGVRSRIISCVFALVVLFGFILLILFKPISASGGSQVVPALIFHRKNDTNSDNDRPPER
jgi:hypothetical protein